MTPTLVNDENDHQYKYNDPFNKENLYLTNGRSEECDRQPLGVLQHDVLGDRLCVRVRVGERAQQAETIQHLINFICLLILSVCSVCVVVANATIQPGFDS